MLHSAPFHFSSFPTIAWHIELQTEELFFLSSFKLICSIIEQVLTITILSSRNLLIARGTIHSVFMKFWSTRFRILMTITCIHESDIDLCDSNRQIVCTLGWVENFVNAVMARLITHYTLHSIISLWGVGEATLYIR